MQKYTAHDLGGREKAGGRALREDLFLREIWREKGSLGGKPRKEKRGRRIPGKRALTLRVLTEEEKKGSDCQRGGTHKNRFQWKKLSAGFVSCGNRKYLISEPSEGWVLPIGLGNIK